MTDDDLVGHAHALLEVNRYVTLGTADRDGRPWTTPVYFAYTTDWTFYWMSETGARHSRNPSERPMSASLSSTRLSRPTTAAPYMPSDGPAN